MSQHRKPNTLFKRYIIATCIIFILIISLLAALLISKDYFESSNKLYEKFYFHRNTFKHPKTIIVRNNEPLALVAKDMEKQKIIKNDRFFVKKFLKNKKYLHPGTYLVKHNLTSDEAIAFFINYKKNIDPNFVLNLYQETNPVAVYSKLVNISKCEDCIIKFAKDNQLPNLSIYGLLKPNIYYLYPKFDVYQFLTNTTKPYINFINSGINLNIGTKTLNAYEILVAASLVQAEGNGQANVDSTVASVIFNRLNKNLPLTLDSTVFFATQHYGGFQGEGKNTNSPYNTYMVVGLPPTPITWIDQKTIEATRNPAITNYIYFYGEKDKPYYFTNSRSDFFQYVAKIKDQNN